MTNFVTLNKEQFESYLPKGFKEIEAPRSKERIYEGCTDNINVGIRIYSSVDIRTNKTRDVGSDAIRVVFWDLMNDRPLGKGKKIYRVEGATNIGQRIKNRIDDFMVDAHNLDIVDFEYVRAILSSNSISWNNFATSLLESLDKWNSLTEGQLAYVLGEINPKGKKTFEAMVKDKDPDFLQKYLDTLEEEEEEYDESFNIEEFERITGSDEEEAYEDIEEVKESIGEATIDEFVQPEQRLVPTSDYKEHKYPFKCFNPVQSEIFPHIKEDKNMIIGANTSAGKTIAAELIMDHVLKNHRVIYLSPLKSLTQEKYDDWQKRFPNEEITILTGDYVLSDKMKTKLAKSNIIVMTSEMCDSRTRKMRSEKNFWLKEVGLVIVDESHILTTNRGHAVETGIMRFASINPKARILFLSATMPNVAELGEWLTTLNGKESTIIYSTWRPVELQVSHHEYQITRNNRGWEDYWSSQEKKRSKAVELVLSKPDEKFLVFCHDKGTGRDIVRRLEKKGVESIFHNADLDLAERLEIEESFQSREGGLRVLVSTSTLAWGRNLPARNVVIVGVHRGLNEVDELDIIQMAGRAGRYGIDDAGFVYLIIPEGSSDFWKETFKNPRPVNSVLNERHTLAFHVLAEVENRVITSTGQLLAWYKRSLAGKQNIIPFDREDAEGLVYDLIQMEMLNGDPVRFGITGLGRVSAWLYFSPYDVYSWFRNFNKLFGNDDFTGMEMTDEVLAWAIADIPSNDFGYIRKDLIPICDEWRWMLRNRGIMVSDACPSVIGAFNCLTDQKEPLITPFKRTIKYDIDRQCQAFSLIDGLYAKWSKENFWKVLPLRVRYGIPEEMVELVKIPGIGGVRAKKLWDRGFKTVADVADFSRKKELLNVFKISMVKKIQDKAKELLEKEG